MKRTYKALLSLLLIGVMTTFGGRASAAEPITLTVTGGPNGGVFYMLAAAWGQVTSTRADITLILEATAGTNENLKLIAANEADFGMGMIADTLDAINGVNDFDGNPARNIRGVAVGHINIFHFVTLDPEINTLADLAGKNVSVGPAGAPYFGPAIIEAAAGLVAGTDYNPQWMSHDQACEALQNGDIDAIVSLTAIPTSAYSSLDATVPGTRFLGVNDEERGKVFAAMPGSYTTITVKADSGGYANIKEDFDTIGAPLMMFTNDEVPEDSIYRLTKAIMENEEESFAIYSVTSEWGFEKQKASIADLAVELHPGARKYYVERGILK